MRLCSPETKLTLIAISSSSSLIFSIYCVPCVVCRFNFYVEFFFSSALTRAFRLSLHKSTTLPIYACTTLNMHHTSIMRLQTHQSSFIEKSLCCVFIYTVSTLLSVVRLLYYSCFSVCLHNVFRRFSSAAATVVPSPFRNAATDMNMHAHTKICKLERETKVK